MPIMIDGELCYTTKEAQKHLRQKVLQCKDELRQELREARKHKDGVIV